MQAGRGAGLALPGLPLPGRGGTEHKYLQELIRRCAERKGYQATVEKQILDGLGSVDVALEKEGRSIACEISVTSTADWELGNIQKCLAAGFEHVILVSSDQKALDKASKAVRAGLEKAQVKRVRFLVPERLLTFLDSLEIKGAGGEESTKDEDEVLTARDVERLLKIDVKTIYGYVERGLLPYVRIQSNLRFLKSEILKWMEEHRFKPNKPKEPGSRK